VAGRVVGVMALFARHALSNVVISELASVADHIALGIERARSTEALRTAEESMRFALTERQKAEAELVRLNAEIRQQRLRVFRATMRTVQDIVNNLLNGLQLVHLEAEGHVPAEVLTMVEGAIQEAALKLKTLADLETVTEKEMALGLGIDYPGAGP